MNPSLSTSSEALSSSVISGLLDANGTRYLTAAGLICLVYDHVLTFPEEVSLVWRAPRSFPKYLFLANRYLVLGTLIIINSAFAGLGLSYDDLVCQGVLLFSSMASIVSIGAANLLILIRVLLLWDKERHVLITLVSAWAISYCATVGLMTATVVILAHAIQWNPLARICTVTESSPTLIAVWALPMLFEISIFFATTYNAISRPRASGTPLAGTLHRDGALFFFAVTCLRIVNLAFAATQNPRLIAYPVFFTWALITVCVHRLLLHIRAAEVRLALEEKRRAAAAIADQSTDPLSPMSPLTPASATFALDGRASPFGFEIPLRIGIKRRHDEEGDVHDHAPGVPITMVELQSFYR